MVAHVAGTTIIQTKQRPALLVVLGSGPTYNAATDISRAKQARVFSAPQATVVTKSWQTAPFGTTPSTDVSLRWPQAKIFAEPETFIQGQRASPRTVTDFTTSADIFLGQDTYGWPPEEIPFAPSNRGTSNVLQSFTPYNAATDVTRLRPQAKYFEETPTFFRLQALPMSVVIGRGGVVPVVTPAVLDTFLPPPWSLPSNHQRMLTAKEQALHEAKLRKAAKARARRWAKEAGRSEEVRGFVKAVLEGKPLEQLRTPLALLEASQQPAPQPVAFANASWPGISPAERRALEQRILTEWHEHARAAVQAKAQSDARAAKLAAHHKALAARAVAEPMPVAGAARVAKEAADREAIDRLYLAEVWQALDAIEAVGSSNGRKH